MPPNSITILAIDDHQDNLITLKAVINDSFPGTKVITALSGLKGIELAKADDPDVILLDIVMPEMDGFEVCKILKANESTMHIPILFLTALKTDKENRIKALEVGGEAFLSKPIEEEELIAQIRAMVKIKTANLMQKLEKERLAKMVVDRTRELEQELQERKLADEKNIQRNKSLQLLNSYSLEISDLLYDDVFPFAIYNIQKLVNAKAAWINIYNEETSELIVKYSTLEDYIHSPAVQLLGKKQIGFKARISKEQYKMMISQDISKQLTLHELSFGSIPEIVANAIEHLFGFGWFIGIVLAHGDKLIGTITFAGDRDQSVPDGDEIRMFANITTNALIRKRAEKEVTIAAEELRQRNEFIQAVIDNLPIGLALNNISSGQKLYVNKQFEEIYGYSDVEIPDVLTFFDKVYPDPVYRELIKDRVMDDMDSGDPLRMIWDNLMITTKSGEHRYIYARNIPLPTQDLMVSTVTDITERKRAEEAKAKLEEQFQHSQKMESIGQLAGGVAHDLNNLLTPILGYGDILLADLDNDDPHKESVLQIVHAGERARDLVRQLLAFGRKQMLEFKLIDINATIYGFSSLLRRTIRENIAINTLLAQNIPAIRGDIGQLEQVIMNLTVNAQDAMPNGGMLVISTSVIDIDEALRIDTSEIKSGKYLLLTISDTGQGMTNETKLHLFEPFFTTKEKGKGTGLGLATTYGIIKQHGGYLNIYSEIGKGTTCNIYLPIIVDDAVIEKVTEIEKPANVNGTETILLVEDNDIVRKLANTVLTQNGYTVLSAENGHEALKLLAEYNDTVDMVLTDVVMPEMGGKELCDKIILQKPDIKILYMSGYAEDTIVHQGILDKGVNFIHKPFTVLMLATKVREVLDQPAINKN